MDPKIEHHPFCNYFARQREGCDMCERMYKNYPMEPGMVPEDLIEKYFPDVTVIKKGIIDGRSPQP